MVFCIGGAGAWFSYRESCRMVFCIERVGVCYLCIGGAGLCYFVLGELAWGILYRERRAGVWYFV